MDLKIVGLAITALLGGSSLMGGARLASLLGYEKQMSPLGEIEFRATYGGFFLMLGLLGIYLRTDDVFLIVGCSWLSAGVTRLIMFLYKRTHTKENMVGLVIELGIGALILFG